MQNNDSPQLSVPRDRVFVSPERFWKTPYQMAQLAHNAGVQRGRRYSFVRIRHRGRDVLLQITDDLSAPRCPFCNNRAYSRWTYED